MADYNTNEAGYWREIAALLRAQAGGLPSDHGPSINGYLAESVAALGGVPAIGRSALLLQMIGLLSVSTGVPLSGRNLGTYMGKLREINALVNAGADLGPARGRKPYLTNIITALEGGGAPAMRPRVWIDNDFGTWAAVSSSDPDNQQLLPFIALAAVEMDILGISCSTSDQTGNNLKSTVQGFFTDIYGADYDNLVADDDRYPLPADLAALVYLHRTSLTASAGYSTATEASTALIAAAHECSADNPLWVLCGAAPGTLCQALHDDITILPKLFVYMVGWNDTTTYGSTLYNYSVDANASNYLRAQMMPGQPWAALRLINNGEGYYGVMPGGNPFTPDREFPLLYAQGHGAIGDFLADSCIDTFQPSHDIMGLKAGDACMIFYVLSNVIRNGTGLDPTQAGWGGRYQRNTARGTNYWDQIPTGENVNGKRGANTLYIWRDAWKAWFADRLQACCSVAPEMYGVESFQDVGSTVADITGRSADPGPGVWANYRPDGLRDATVVYVSSGEAYMRGTEANTSWLTLDGVPMPEHGNYEVEAIVRNTNVALNGGGPVLAMTGDLTTGDHWDAYQFDADEHTISKERNASATNHTVALSTFPVTNNKFYRQKFRHLDNGDGTFTYTFWSRNQYGAWVEINTEDDDADPIFLDPGQAGFRLNQTFQCYSFVARSIPNVSNVPTVPQPDTLVVTPNNTANSIAYTAGYHGGSPVTSRTLHRGLTADFVPSALNQIAAPTSSPYNDTGLTNGLTYYYKMVTINALGPSDPSTVQSGTPAGVTAYTAWPGQGWFDAADDATKTLNVTALTALANKRTGGGDLTYAGTAGKIQQVASGRNGLPILRLTRDVTSQAALPRLVSTTSSPLSQQLQGSDKPHTYLYAFMPTDANTGGGPNTSRSVSAGSYENNGFVRRSASASGLYKQPTTSPSSIDLPAMPANVPVILAVRDNGVTVDVWVTSLTKTLDGVARDVPALSDQTVFRLFAYAAAGASNPTYVLAQHSLDFYEYVDASDARSDADVEAAITALAEKWAITLV